MNFRSALVVSLALLGAQTTLTASTSYGFGTIPTTPNPPNNGVGVSLGNENYLAGVWTETNVNGVTTTANNGNTDENIVCIVTLAGTTNVCGNPGPNGAASISIPAAPTNTAPLTGAGVTNYLLTDGDPQWGAPVWTQLNGLVSGDGYQISFYQAANEEDGNSHAYDDSWLAYLLPTSDTTGTYICPQAYCSDNGGTVTAAPGGSTLAFNGNTSTTLMADTAGGTIGWEQETFTFVATATTQVLEFVTNVAASGTDAVLGAGTTFEPPLLALADVTLTDNSVPEPGTWTLTLLGAGLVFAGSRLRRRFAGRR